jgi:hypothetical protein
MKKTTTLLLTLALFSGLAASQNSVSLEVDKVKVEPTPLKTSEYADVWVEVTNDGSTDAEGVELDYVDSYPFSADPGEKTSWEVGRLVPGEEHVRHIQVRVDKNAVQGTNQLKFRTISDTGVSVTQEIPVEVRSDNDILAVSEVDFPENVAPGSENEMSITLENLADGQLKNIEADLDLTDIPVAASESASRVVTSVPSDESRSVSFSLDVDEAAENGVYKVPVDISYENEAGNEFSRETTIGVVVGGSPQLEAGLNSVENELTPGSTSTVTVRLVNRGRGTADFVKMDVEDSEDFKVLSPGSVYLGDMDPDDYQTADVRLHVSQDAENISLPVDISYRGVTGENVDTQNVYVPVYTSEQLQRYGLASGGSPLPFVVVLVLVVGGVYYWRRRRKRE